MKRDEIKQETLTPPESVSYFVYRADLAREARHTAWWRAFAIALAAVMIAAVVWFFWRESQFEDVKYQQQVVAEVDGDGRGSYERGYSRDHADFEKRLRQMADEAPDDATRMSIHRMLEDMR